MMVSKAGTIMTLRMLGIFCALVMGFVCLVGSSEDAATDALGIDDSVDETAEVTLDPVTTSSSSISSIQADSDCGTMTINEAVTDIENDIGQSLDDISSLSITITGISGTYTADWEPSTEGPITCSLSISGTESTTIAVTPIDGATGDVSDVLSQDDLDVFNHYLSNRSDPFTYCVSCTNTDGITSYSVTYNITIDVRITGDVDVL